jgi:type VI secretion system secreted protein Hcp
MATVDYFLKVSGIDGESTDDKHKNEIELESWSFGVSNSGSGHSSGTTGSGAGKASFQDIHFVAKLSKASPKLMLACATGEHISEATLTCRKAGGDQQEYLTIKLNDAFVSSFQTGGSNGNIVPMDQFSLNFGKCEEVYKQQDASKGSVSSPVKVGYNIAANKKI